ncbi:hypothetical protein D3C76_1466740 [compost metagenome]
MAQMNSSQLPPTVTEVKARVSSTFGWRNTACTLCHWRPIRVSTISRAQDQIMRWVRISAAGTAEMVLK